MINQELELSTMLVELDCLLDTRLSLLSELDDEKLRKVLDMYHKRDIDQFPFYSFNRFKENYDKRDKSVLNNALITPVMFLIQEFVKKTLLQIINSPFHLKPKVIINIHPYELTEEEINDIIKLIVIKTNKECDVEVISRGVDRLTVGYVKENISIMVMYKYYEWIEFHSKNKAFEKLTCPDINLFGPAIYFLPKQPRSDIKEDPFTSMEELAKPLIGLKLFPVEYFSFIKIKPQQQTST